MPANPGDHRADALATRKLIRDTHKSADARRKLVFEYCASNRELIIKTRLLITETLAILRDTSGR